MSRHSRKINLYANTKNLSKKEKAGIKVSENQAGQALILNELREIKKILKEINDSNEQDLINQSRISWWWIIPRHS